MTGNYSEISKSWWKPNGVNKERPRFVKSVKDGEEPEYCNYIQGNLIKIERSTYEYEGQELEKINYIFTNDEGDHLLSLSGGWPTFYNGDWLNRLVNIDGKIGKIKILLWDSYHEEKDKHYTRGSIHEMTSRGAFEKVKGKYPHDEIPKVEYEKYKGQTIKDDEARMEFFSKILEEVQGKLQFTSAEEVKAYYANQEEKPKAELRGGSKKKAPAGADDEEFDDDVPF